MDSLYNLYHWPRPAHSSPRTRKVLQRAFIEQLEPRQLLTVSSVSIAVENSPVVEGSGMAISLSASTDTSLTGYQISWGDGQNSSYPGDATEADHVYAEEGDYDISATATDSGGYGGGYGDGYGGDAGSASTDTTVDVQEADLGAQLNQFTAYPGDPLPTYIGDLQDANAYADGTDYSGTINWGDGTPTVPAYFGPDGYGGWSISVASAHAYTSPGTYTLSATLYDGDTSVPVSNSTVTINPQTVSIYATHPDFAGAEGGRIPADVTVTRSGGQDNLPLTVYFSQTGTASPSTDYQDLDGETGLPIGGSITLPAGQSSRIIEIMPVDDSVPEWTENVITAVTGMSTSTYLCSSPPVTREIIDNDLSLTLDSSTIPVSGDGTHNLVPMHLHFPQDVKTGATVFLGMSAANAADVWMSNSPSSNDTPLLGGNILYKSWTVGTDQIPTTLYVGAIHGSGSWNDITFLLQDNDSNATPKPAAPTLNSAVVQTTAIELAFGANDANQGVNAVTADSTLASKDIYIAEDTEDPATVTINLSCAAYPAPLAGHPVTWTAAGSNVSATSGSFASSAGNTLTLTPSGGNLDFTLVATDPNTGLQRTIHVHAQAISMSVDSSSNDQTGIFNISRTGSLAVSLDVYLSADATTTSGFTYSGAVACASGYKVTIPAGSSSVQVTTTFVNPDNSNHDQSIMLTYLGASPTILGVGKFSFFQTGAVRIVQQNGTVTQATASTAGFRAALQAAIASGSPITELQITGHGNSTLIQLNGNPDIITMGAQGKEIDDNQGDLTALLLQALAPNAIVLLDGCHTGDGPANLAQQMSAVLVGRTVKGGWSYLARFGKNTVAGPMNTYVNGVKQ